MHCPTYLHIWMQLKNPPILLLQLLLSSLLDLWTMETTKISPLIQLQHCLQCLPIVVLYRLENKTKKFLIIYLILLLWLLFSAFFAFLCMFCAVVPVISTDLHSTTLVCLHLLHSTRFPLGEIKEIKVNKNFKHIFLLWNFACWFDLFLICVMHASCGCGVTRVVCLCGLWKWV